MKIEDDLWNHLTGKKGLIQKNLRQRVLRILSGESNFDDFKTLFLELRSEARDRKCFREIGDFVAHRDIRDRGLIAKIVRNFFISARIFYLFMEDTKPSIEEVHAAAIANINLSTDKEIATECAMTRQGVKAAVNRAANMLARGFFPIDRDRFAFNTYGNRLKWYPAFLDDQLIEEWIAVLRYKKLLRDDEVFQMRAVSHYVTLTVIALLHGSEVELENKDRVELRAGYFNKERKLEVKAYITINDTKKPISTPICIFLTNLLPENLCDNALLESSWHGWDMPIYFSNGMLRVS